MIESETFLIVYKWKMGFLIVYKRRTNFLKIYWWKKKSFGKVKEQNNILLFILMG